MLLQILLFFKFTEARESSNLAYYQKVVASQNLTDVEIGKSYRLRVGDSVIITLPRVNLTDRVLWGFRASSLENNSSRRFQFSCHEGRCATNFELEGRLTFHKTHFSILNLQLEDG